MTPTLRILGTRGLPAAHSGFEYFADHLAHFLVNRGWRVVVYCQHEGSEHMRFDTWHGIERVHISVHGGGPMSTIKFDWIATQHASKHRDLCLTLGYNTALFCALMRWRGVTNIINMDGIEWSRAKWSRPVKFWFWLNEWAGCWLGNHLVADHPEIKTHLTTRVRAAKISTIAYGADHVSTASTDAVSAFGLTPGKYVTVIARPEPENSVLEIVQAFSLKKRGLKLAVLGNYSDAHSFKVAVRQAASDEVVFLGPIYDKPIVQALRFHCAAYIHGHQVGGTNPSLVEALGAENAIIAHDNRFNRWVIGEGGRYFSDAKGLAAILDDVLSDQQKLAAMEKASLTRFHDAFTWPMILSAYEDMLRQFLPKP